MKNALLKYRIEETNIGDYIQSLAAKRFLPNTDIFISREELSLTNETAKIILNGWFMHEPKNWPPSKTLKPKFVSFHINDYVKEALTTKESLEYYKKNEPIGCRDKFTLELLKSKNIDAYFSGCLTLTLEKEKYNTSKNKDQIVFCDILHHKNDVSNKKKPSFWKKARNPHKQLISFFKNLKNDKIQQKKINSIIKKLIPQDIIDSSIKVSNQDFNVKTTEEKFKRAEELLNLYASAKLVVTSRIHVALPCVAFGTPVIFIRPDRDTSRFDGLTDLFNTFTLDEIKNTSKTELQNRFLKVSTITKKEYLVYREKLIKDVTAFMGEN